MSTDDQDIADAIEQQIARDILGPWVDAPTAQLLLPQARQIPPAAWEIIRRVLETNPEAREDVTCLTKLLASESQAAIDRADADEAADDNEATDVTEDAKASEFSMEPAARLPLTDDCHHYTGKHEVPWDIQKCVIHRQKHSRRSGLLIHFADISARDTPSFHIMMLEFT